MQYNTAPGDGQQPPSRHSRSWRRWARELAAWAALHLINRSDVWGQYLPVEQRTPKRKAVTRHGELSRADLRRHFRGDCRGDLIGLHSTSQSGRCQWIAIDIDHHGAASRSIHRRNRKAAIALYKRVKGLGFEPLLTSSNGRGGYHLLILLARAVPSRTAYRFARWLVRDWSDLGLDVEPETFPRQPKLSAKCRYGNWLRLPGRHHTLDHYSKVWNGIRWLSGEEAIETILAVGGCSTLYIPAAVFSFTLPEDQRVAEPVAVSHVKSRRSGSSLDRVLGKLCNVRPCGDQWSARCPAHCDHNNSLSVCESADGTVLLHCHAGCEVEDIVDETGLSFRDLFSRRKRVRRRFQHRTYRQRTRRRMP